MFWLKSVKAARTCQHHCARRQGGSERQMLTTWDALTISPEHLLLPGSIPFYYWWPGLSTTKQQNNNNNNINKTTKGKWWKWRWQMMWTSWEALPISPQHLPLPGSIPFYHCRWSGLSIKYQWISKQNNNNNNSSISHSTSADGLASGQSGDQATTCLPTKEMAEGDNDKDDKNDEEDVDDSYDIIDATSSWGPWPSSSQCWTLV